MQFNSGNTMNKKNKLFCFTIFLLIISMVYAEDYTELFKIRNGNEWYVETASNGLVLYAYKIRPEEKGTPLPRGEIIETARKFLEDNSDCLGLSNFVYKYDEFNEEEDFSYWIVDFEGNLISGLIPPHTYLRIFMTRDGNVYSLGDIDFYSLGNIAIIQGNIIGKDKATESAEEDIETTKPPINAELMTNFKKDDAAYPFVWKIEFGDPDNKEVLIDAKTGKVLSIKSVEESAESVNWNKLFSNSRIIAIFFVILIVVIIIVLILIKRKGRQREE